MVVGITGHQQFENAAIFQWVEQQMREKLNRCEVLSGLSSLAKGADQMFARLVLQLGGRVEAVLPFADYAKTFDSISETDAFQTLLAHCSNVTTLAFDGTPERSYLAAGKYVVDHSELLIAVWDGKPAAGVGGTGDIVAYAKRLGKPIFQINPDLRTTTEEEQMTRRTRIKFTATKTEKRPKQIEFKTSEGDKVSFTAEVPTKVRKRVNFLADPKKNPK